jgi:tryptophan-rich sensory protein
MKILPENRGDHMQDPDSSVETKSPYSLTNARNIVALVVFLLVVFAGGSAIGVSTLPGDWYAGLIKPSFNPPNWIFGPVWSLLYVAIAVAGWRSWQRDRAGSAMKVWLVQMLANFAWSPVFFAAQRVDLAFGVILIVLVSILAFIAVTWRQDRLSALLFVPYALWVGFASTLNGAILLLN